MRSLHSTTLLRWPVTVVKKWARVIRKKLPPALSRIGVQRLPRFNPYPGAGLISGEADLFNKVTSGHRSIGWKRKLLASFGNSPSTTFNCTSVPSCVGLVFSSRFFKRCTVQWNGETVRIDLTVDVVHHPCECTLRVLSCQFGFGKTCRPSRAVPRGADAPHRDADLNLQTGFATSQHQPTIHRAKVLDVHRLLATWSRCPVVSTRLGDFRTGRARLNLRTGFTRFKRSRDALFAKNLRANDAVAWHRWPRSFGGQWESNRCRSGRSPACPRAR